MGVYLLTWNAKTTGWNPASAIKLIRRKGFAELEWSCGRTKRIQPGDRVYLLRQGLEPRGIVASGNSLSTTYSGPHWRNPSQTTQWVKVRFDAMFDAESEGLLPLEELQEGELGNVNWRTQSSGIAIKPEAADELHEKWTEFLSIRGQYPSSLPDEVITPQLYHEGATRTLSVNAYERDLQARNACIKHYGTKCSVCDFDFFEVYGELGKGYIHVHHVVPLSEIGERYLVNPVKDLRPVCPNCHAMLHRKRPALSITSLKKLLRTHK